MIFVRDTRKTRFLHGVLYYCVCEPAFEMENAGTNFLFFFLVAETLSTYYV